MLKGENWAIYLLMQDNDVYFVSKPIKLKPIVMIFGHGSGMGFRMGKTTT